MLIFIHHPASFTAVVPPVLVHPPTHPSTDQSRGSGGETPEVGDSPVEDHTLLESGDPEKACDVKAETEAEAEVELEAEAEVEADAQASASLHQEDSKASSTTSSADTDSPVMVNVDVRVQYDDRRVIKWRSYHRCTDDMY